MNQPPVEIESRIMRLGLKRALVRGRDTILCILGPASIRFIGISGLRMMISWEHPVSGPPAPRVYVFPPFVNRLMTSALGQEIERVTLAAAGPEAVMTVSDKDNSYTLRWPNEPRQFLAPPEFGQMLAVPKQIITLQYLRLSDAAHQAVANLVNLQAMHNIPSDRLAILVDLRVNQLTLDGRTLVHGASGAYYFDPRLLIRALEMIKSNTLRVGMTPGSILRPPAGNRAVLTILADQEGWRVQCSLLSIGLDTQKLYPLPPERLAAVQSGTSHDGTSHVGTSHVT